MKNTDAIEALMAVYEPMKDVKGVKALDIPSVKIKADEAKANCQQLLSDIDDWRAPEVELHHFAHP